MFMFVSLLHPIILDRLKVPFHAVIIAHVRGEFNQQFKIFFHAALTMFLGITFPFFGGLLGFLGGFVLAPTTYFVRKI